MKIKNLVLILIAFFFEYLRDYCFININFYIEFLEKSNNGLNVFNYTDSLVLNFIKNLKISSLIKLKWIMSLVFILMYSVLGILFSKWNFSDKEHERFLKLYLYGGMGILILSFAIFSLSKLLNIENQYNFYFVSLELSHFVQSSLYPLSFILIFWYFSYSKS
jgi:hypothetical protein